MRTSILTASAAALLILAGCGGAGSDNASGGSTGSSRSSSGGSGGASSSSGGSSGGGSSARSGGSSASSSSPSGGSSASSSASSGGSSGGTSSGGTTAQGGQSASGGSSSAGGTASGGTSGGGTTGQGGTGGTSASSSSESPDASPDVAPDAALCIPGGTCSEPNQTVTSGTGTHCCFTYENWVGSGNASMTLKPDGFSVNWTGTTQFVARKGIRPGSGKIVTEYSSTFSPNGNSYLCLYGWTTNPLAEYYVVDGWGSWRPPGATAIGTVSSDGGTYDIYKTIRNNMPSIEGTKTFPQYWSVRQQKKTSGTITLANHIAAWATKDMPMGTFYEVSMTVEGYMSAGTADVKFTMK